MFARKHFIAVLIVLITAGPLHGTTVKVKCLINTGERAFLITAPYPDLPGIILDSTRVSNKGIFKFSFVPDPSGSYQICVGNAKLLHLGFIETDNVVFVQVPDKNTFRVLYDRNGAITASFKFFDSYLNQTKNYNKMLCDTGRLSFERFLGLTLGTSHDLILQARDFAEHYPDHVYFSHLLRERSEDYYTLEILKYQWMQEYCLNRPARYEADWADTVSMASESPEDMLDFAQYALKIRAQRWYWHGIDTTNSDQYLIARQFRIAQTWQLPLRDFALSYISAEAANICRWEFPVNDAMTLTQQALDTAIIDKAETWTIQTIRNNLEQLKTLRTGYLAQSFKLPDSEGNMHSLNDYRGKAVLIHYWGTWCGNCLDELQTTLNFEKSHAKDTNFVCIDIAIENDGLKNWKRFIQAHDLHYAVELYADPDQIRNPLVPTLFQWVTGIPTYVMLNRQGGLVCPFEKHPPNKQLDEDIEKAEQY